MKAMDEHPEIEQMEGNGLDDVPASIPEYLTHLSKVEVNLHTVDGRPIDVWELAVPNECPSLSNWATTFRQHYCFDTEIDELRDGTGLSRAEYLLDLVFPDKSKTPGPPIRAGDFAEILVSDYVEHLLGYWVPRGKFAEKASRDESVKGVDILGFLMTTPPDAQSTDVLLAFEVKAQLTGNQYKGRLQDAIDDSSKDILRRAMTLNATKRRLLRSGEKEMSLIVQRFQNQADYPYIFRSGAAAVLSDAAYDEATIQDFTTIENHANPDYLDLIVIRGNDLMNLVHALYQRAADEA